jgi:hypothetical protein
MVLHYNFTGDAGIETHQLARNRPMMTRFILVALLALPGSLGGSPWDKAPAKWDLADVYRILQDSPWSPAGIKLEAEVYITSNGSSDRLSDRRACQFQ